MDNNTHASAKTSTIVFLDFEGTGTVAGYPDEPWQIGLVLVRNGEVCLDSTYSSYLRVGDRPFNPYAPGRHAELRDTLSAAPALRDLWPQLSPWFSHDALGAHNTATEKRYLRQAFPMIPRRPWIDTLRLARAAYPEAASHSLEDLLAGMDLVNSVEKAAPGRAPHDALFDAIGSAFILEKLLALPEWEGLSLSALAGIKPTAGRRSKS